MYKNLLKYSGFTDVYLVCADIYHVNLDILQFQSLTVVYTYFILANVNLLYTTVTYSQSQQFRLIVFIMILIRS